MNFISSEFLENIEKCLFDTTRIAIHVAVSISILDYIGTVVEKCILTCLDLTLYSPAFKHGVVPQWEN